MAQNQEPASPFSARPSSLEAPVPGKSAKLTAQSLLEDFNPPEQAAPNPSDQGASSGTVPSPLQTTTPTTVGNEFAPEPTAGQSLSQQNIAQQILDFNDRVAADIAGDPKSVQLTLEKRLGKENVRMKDGVPYIRKGQEKQFRPLDPKTFEIVGDIFADMYRENIQALAGTAGGLAGAASAGPVGAFAGTASAAGGAGAAVDLMGEQAMGVVKAEPQGALQRTGQATAEGIQYALLDGIFKEAGNRWAAYSAKREGLKKLAEIPPSERLRQGVKDNLQTLQELRQMGLTKTIPGTDIEATAEQLLPFDPRVSKVAESVSAQKSYQAAQEIAAKNFADTSLDLLEEAASIAPGSLKKAVKTGIPQTKDVSTAEINALFNSVKRAEGAVIGEFRDKAIKTAGKAPMPTPRVAESLKGIFGELGVSMRGGELMFPESDALAQVLGTDSPAYINGLKKDLTLLNNKLVKGGMTIEELTNLSRLIGAKNEGARSLPGMYRKAIGQLSSALRSDARDAMATALPPEDAANYLAKMTRFKSISESMEQLGGFLSDDIGINTFAKGLVNKGRDGIANLRAAKSFLMQENPETYKKVVGQYLEELVLSKRVPETVAQYDIGAVRKQLAALGPEYLDELFPAKSGITKDVVFKTFDLAHQINKNISAGREDQAKTAAKAALKNLNWLNRGVNFVSAALQLGTRDSRLLKMMSRDGVESFLTEIPPKQRGPMRQTLNGILELARQSGTIAVIRADGRVSGGKPLEQ